MQTRRMVKTAAYGLATGGALAAAGYAVMAAAKSLELLTASSA
jgi:hypothetical protein